jgi:hypothetical protein
LPSGDTASSTSFLSLVTIADMRHYIDEESGDHSTDVDAMQIFALMRLTTTAPGYRFTRTAGN